MATFWAYVGNIGLLFILLSGHTGVELKNIFVHLSGIEKMELNGREFCREHFLKIYPGSIIRGEDRFFF